MVTTNTTDIDTQTYLFAADVIQFACCILAMVTLLVGVLMLSRNWRRLIVGVRVVLLTAAMCVFGWSFMVHNPAMNREAVAYWNAAEKPGYSGTVVFCREEPISHSNGIGVAEHHALEVGVALRARALHRVAGHGEG